MRSRRTSFCAAVMRRSSEDSTARIRARPRDNPSPCSRATYRSRVTPTRSGCCSAKPSGPGRPSARTAADEDGERDDGAAEAPRRRARRRDDRQHAAQAREHADRSHRGARAALAGVARVARRRATLRAGPPSSAPARSTRSPIASPNACRQSGSAHVRRSSCSESSASSRRSAPSASGRGALRIGPCRANAPCCAGSICCARTIARSCSACSIRASSRPASSRVGETAASIASWAPTTFATKWACFRATSGATSATSRRPSRRASRRSRSAATASSRRFDGCRLPRTPGAWAAAVAAREVVVSPVTPGVVLPLGLDAGRVAFRELRSLAARLGASEWLSKEGPARSGDRRHGAPRLARPRPHGSSSVSIRSGFSGRAVLDDRGALMARRSRIRRRLTIAMLVTAIIPVGFAIWLAGEDHSRHVGALFRARGRRSSRPLARPVSGAGAHGESRDAQRGERHGRRSGARAGRDDAGRRRRAPRARATLRASIPASSRSPCATVSASSLPSTAADRSIPRKRIAWRSCVRSVAAPPPEAPRPSLGELGRAPTKRPPPSSLDDDEPEGPELLAVFGADKARFDELSEIERISSRTTGASSAGARRTSAATC